MTTALEDFAYVLGRRFRHFLIAGLVCLGVLIVALLNLWLFTVGVWIMLALAKLGIVIAMAMCVAVPLLALFGVFDSKTKQ